MQTSGRPPMSPQAFLDVLTHSRGYSTRRYRTLQTGYYAKPTEFQQASYNVYLVKLVRANHVEKLRSVMQTGISPNPCNAYGESLVHMVCRRGDHELLSALLECGTSIQVSDDYGRTPLHDACCELDSQIAPLRSALFENALNWKLLTQFLTSPYLTDHRGRQTILSDSRINCGQGHCSFPLDRHAWSRAPLLCSARALATLDRIFGVQKRCMVANQVRRRHTCSFDRNGSQRTPLTGARKCPLH